jgi:hypothetical protein
MDESNYKRLSCGSLGCNKDSWSRDGLCLPHKKQQEHVKYKVKCSHCGKDYDAMRVGSMYCSNNCKQASWVKRNPEKMVARLKNNPACIRSFSCEVCKSEFNALRKRKYCHAKCSWSVRDQKKRDKAEANHRKSANSVFCKGCGSCFSPLYGYFTKSVHCSVCQMSIPDSAWSVRRRERIKTASIEVVVREKVFDRDKWRCAMCGVKTIKAPYMKNSAELDHIVPLSLGGQHSYANTQCSCRACNGSKGAKAKGQTLLFG